MTHFVACRSSFELYDLKHFLSNFVPIFKTATKCQVDKVTSGMLKLKVVEKQLHAAHACFTLQDTALP